VDFSGVAPTRSIFDMHNDVERAVREARQTTSEREAAFEHERRWYGRPEAVIREEMERAVRRRHPGGVTWPHVVPIARKRAV
jgi:hypothetical protein